MHHQTWAVLLLGVVGAVAHHRWITEEIPTVHIPLGVVAQQTIRRVSNVFAVVRSHMAAYVR